MLAHCWSSSNVGVLSSYMFETGHSEISRNIALPHTRTHPTHTPTHPHTHTQEAHQAWSCLPIPRSVSTWYWRDVAKQRSRCVYKVWGCKGCGRVYVLRCRQGSNPILIRRNTLPNRYVSYIVTGNYGDRTDTPFHRSSVCSYVHVGGGDMQSMLAVLMAMYTNGVWGRAFTRESLDPLLDAI